MVRVSTPSSTEAVRRGRRRRRLLALLGAPFVLAALAALALALAFVGSERVRARLLEASGARSGSGVVRAFATAPAHLLNAAAASTPPPQLAIDIKFKHLHRIHEKRAKALRTGRLVTRDEDFVPAEIDVGPQSMGARMRLAGERADLLEGNKWPMRLRVRGEGHVFGMRSMVLRPPAQRGFETEALFLEHLRAEDVVAPRYRFLKVSMNGKSLGLMAVEEFFSRELLESQQRRDAPVVRLIPASHSIDAGDEPNPDELVFDPRIVPLRASYVDRSNALSRNLKLAKKLLRGYLVGKLPAGEVFDVERMARFLAVAELWGARNALQWQNLRFYFNPLTARLEPVGHAAELQTRSSGPDLALLADPFLAGLLQDPRIHDASVRALRRIAESMLEEEFARDLEARQAAILTRIHREYPLRLAFDLGRVLERAEALRGLDALGSRAAATPTPSLDDAALPLPSTSVDALLAQHPFLRWDEEERFARARPGHWEVKGSLILPDGAGLELPPGTILNFGPRQGIIARGPLRFLGTPDQPVVLEGPAASERSKLWAGVYVIESQRPSRWTHVAIRNTGGFRRGRWRLEGGVVFRKAPVEMERCVFRGNRSDDSLNLIRLRFALRDVRIYQAASDALDGDFVEGEIRGGHFAAAGGDGADFGGSRIVIEGARFEDIRDKALAVGEGSRLEADALSIERAGIGIASKNGAVTEISNSTLRGIANVAFTAYMNRAQYGPGKLHVRNTRVEDAALRAFAQIGSEITVDGVPVQPLDAAIDRLYKDQDRDREVEP